MPSIRIVPVIHVGGPESIDEALQAGRTADALLLDSGNQRLTVKELGGTGRVHDWSISREIVRRSDVPVFLAGGLRAENIGEAVRTVQPFGVDVCSGVRTAGRLDPGKVRSLISAVPH